MTTLMIKITIFLFSLVPITGNAVYYNPGVMEAVAAHRGLSPTSCMVSTHLAPLGSWVVVVGQSSLVCKVIDKPNPKDMNRFILRRKIVVELNFESVAAICPNPKPHPAEECPVTIYIQGG